jgi:hypothetical protein
MDYWMRCAARWQREYMAMKAERDHLAQLLKFHHQARAEVQS